MLPGPERNLILLCGRGGGGLVIWPLRLRCMARDQQSPVLAGQILLSPMVDACLATCSVREAKAGPADCLMGGWLAQVSRAAVRKLRTLTLRRSSRRALPALVPALLVTAEDDHLRDETFNYARRLRESGVLVRHHLLSAPTGWPCALHKGDGDARWAGALRESFAGIFRRHTELSVTAASFQHHVQA